MFDPSRQVRFLNIILRGCVLASKFLLILVLAVYLSPEDLGLYGLIVATVAYGIYPLGFDFYAYNARELIKTEQREWGRLLKSQGALHLRLYAIFLPLFFLFFVFELLPWRLAPWCFLLLILEHLNQELNRLLVAMSRPLSASLALFMRQGAWVLVIVAWMYQVPEMRSLKNVLYFWVMGDTAALCVAAYAIMKLPIAGWCAQVDWAWVRRGIKISAPIFTGTLILSTISTVDRYWFRYLQGSDLLGVYIFYISVAASLMSFLDAGIFSFSYPRMVHAASRGEYALIRRVMKNAAIQVTFFSMSFAIIVYLIIPPVLHFIGKDEYIASEGLFFVLIAAMVVHGYSYIPHYALYAKNQDREIIKSHFFGAFVFIVSAMVVSKFSEFYAIPIAVMSAYSAIFIWKFFSEIKITQ